MNIKKNVVMLTSLFLIALLAIVFGQTVKGYCKEIPEKTQSIQNLNNSYGDSSLLLRSDASTLKSMKTEGETDQNALATNPATEDAVDIEGDFVTYAKRESGKWVTNTGNISIKKNKKAYRAFQKALNSDKMLGVDYKAVALLGTKNNNGKVYSILCRAKVVVPGAKPYFVVMNVKMNKNGKCTIKNITDVSFS